MKKILIAASNYWTSPSQVGTHSIARAMVDLGWQVFFVSEPITPFHFLQRNNAQLKQRHEIHKAGGVSYFDDKLFTYVPFSLAAPQSYPFLRSKFVHQNWQNFTRPNIIKLIKENNELMIKLINDLLIVSRIEENHLVLKPKKIYFEHKGAGKISRWKCKSRIIHRR